MSDTILLPVYKNLVLSECENRELTVNEMVYLGVGNSIGSLNGVDLLKLSEAYEIQTLFKQKLRDIEEKKMETKKLSVLRHLDLETQAILNDKFLQEILQLDSFFNIEETSSEVELVAFDLNLAYKYFVLEERTHAELFSRVRFLSPEYKLSIKYRKENALNLKEEEENLCEKDRSKVLNAFIGLHNWSIQNFAFEMTAEEYMRGRQIKLKDFPFSEMSHREAHDFLVQKKLEGNDYFWVFRGSSSVKSSMYEGGVPLDNIYVLSYLAPPKNGKEIHHIMFKELPGGNGFIFGSPKKSRDGLLYFSKHEWYPDLLSFFNAHVDKL